MQTYKDLYAYMEFIACLFFLLHIVLNYHYINPAMFMPAAAKVE